MLNSFVAPQDYPLLLEIIEKVRTKTLNTDVSILVIYGNFCTGKSTFLDILAALGGVEHLYCQMSSSFDREFSKYIVILNTFEVDDLDLLQKYHNRINGEFVASYIYTGREIIRNPGTLVVSNLSKPNIVVETSNKRKPVYLHFPYQFDTRKISRDDVVKKCLLEIRSRNTIVFLGVLRRLRACSKDMRTMLGKIFYVMDKSLVAME